MKKNEMNTCCEPKDKGNIEIEHGKSVGHGKVVVALVLLLVVGYGVAQKASRPVVAKDVNNDTASLITSVEKIMELPKNEVPTTATVVDLAKLKGEAFFRNAMVGDKVLAYAGRMLAILYRPSTGKIIEVAPIVVDSASGQSLSATLVDTANKK